MSSNKKRKVEATQGSQMLSAVALRRMLLQKSSDVEEKPEPAVPENGASSDASGRADTKNSRRVKRAVKEETTAPVKIPSGRSISVEEAQGDATSGQNQHLSQASSTSTAGPADKIVQLSTFKPSKENCKWKPDGNALLTLPDGERLVILGSYGVRLQTGEATIAGAILHPSDTIQWVHAPHCHALPVLRCSDDTILELHSHPAATNLRQLERLSPVFGNLWNEDVRPVQEDKTKSGRSFQILSSSADGPRRAILRDLRSPAEWNKKISALSVPKKGRNAKFPVVFVCGPKSSGKSTFARLLANRLITDQAGTKKRIWPGVAVLDIDPGQPEYSPPGVVSLVHITEPNLGPPFCHPGFTDGDKRALRSHAVAAVSPGSRPEHHVECVRDLYHHYELTLRGKTPLIVNTPGWIQGTGLDLLSTLIETIRPTEVIYMSEDGPDDTVQRLRAACNKIPFTTLPSQSSEYTSRTALHLRTMQTMSYLHIDPATSEKEGMRWDPTPLTSVPPLQVRYVGPTSGVAGVMSYGFKEDPELLTDAINGCILAVVEIEDNRAFDTPFDNQSPQDDLSTKHDDDMEIDAPANASGSQPFFSNHQDVINTPDGIPYIQSDTPLDPRYSRALGIALLRGIDKRRKLLQLLSPISPARLNTVRDDGHQIVLVAGSFDTPTWAYTEDRYNNQTLHAGAAAPESQEDSMDVITDEDTDDDSSSSSEGGGAEDEVPTSVVVEELDLPWTEMLRGNEKRAVGSRVWRVRRDLGRG